MSSSSHNFAIIDKGKTSGQRSYILMEKGVFYGMGFLPEDVVISGIDQLKSLLTVYPSNDYIKNMIRGHAQRFPEKVIYFDSQSISMEIQL